jgi:hypothetical protein
MRFYAAVMFVVAAGLFLFQPMAEARRGILPGRAEGVISVDVGNTTPEKIDAALDKVFVGDGFKRVSSEGDRVVFERPARFGKDRAYGGVVFSDGGAWERMEVIITDEGEGRYNLQCNPSMVANKGQGIFEDETEVLKAFAGEYRRMMRRVQLEA